MSIDVNSTPILFSIGTWFSYKINRRYYNDVHYVWCTTFFNKRNQPVSSNPYSICKRYFDQTLSGDRHTKEIDNNKAGILRGAQAKLESKIITKQQFKEICQLVNLADYEDFQPVLYIINARKVGSERCIEVEEADRASDTSIEYKIYDLAADEYELVDFKRLLSDYVEAADRRAGK